MCCVASDMTSVVHKRSDGCGVGIWTSGWAVASRVCGGDVEQTRGWARWVCHDRSDGRVWYAVGKRVGGMSGPRSVGRMCWWRVASRACGVLWNRRVGGWYECAMVGRLGVCGVQWASGQVTGATGRRCSVGCMRWWGGR